ncbi:MAG: NeuD/PglB/VioB family sugar acetyltransferase [Verrucomicrobiota bacterium]
MKARLVIWGAGGAAKVAASIARSEGEFEIAGFLDDLNPERKGDSFYGASILGGREQLASLGAGGIKHIIIAIGDNAARRKLASVSREAGLSLISIVHPTASVSIDVTIGEGTLIKAGAVIESEARIGDNVIIGAQTYVGHDAIVEDNAHLSGGSKLGGSSIVEEGAWLGLGSVVKDRIRIGQNAEVGAGAVVLEDLPPDVVATGNPAQARWRPGLFGR